MNVLCEDINETPVGVWNSSKAICINEIEKYFSDIHSIRRK